MTLAIRTLIKERKRLEKKREQLTKTIDSINSSIEFLIQSYQKTKTVNIKLKAINHDYRNEYTS